MHACRTCVTPGQHRTTIVHIAHRDAAARAIYGRMSDLRLWNFTRACQGWLRRMHDCRQQYTGNTSFTSMLQVSLVQNACVVRCRAKLAKHTLAAARLECSAPWTAIQYLHRAYRLHDVCGDARCCRWEHHKRLGTKRLCMLHACIQVHGLMPVYVPHQATLRHLSGVCVKPRASGAACSNQHAHSLCRNSR